MKDLKFDPCKVLALIKAERANMKKVKLLKVSKLNPYRGELLALRHAGASYAELAHWLTKTKGCLTHKSTVMRFLRHNEAENKS